MVPIFKMTDYSGNHVQYTEIPSPKVGDSIPEVKIGVININDMRLKNEKSLRDNFMVENNYCLVVDKRLFRN